jgi:hypothetical protein
MDNGFHLSSSTGAGELRLAQDVINNKQAQQMIFFISINIESRQK